MGLILYAVTTIHRNQIPKDYSGGGGEERKKDSMPLHHRDGAEILHEWYFLESTSSPTFIEI
jgi:hypothetical protein